MTRTRLALQPSEGWRGSHPVWTGVCQYSRDEGCHGDKGALPTCPSCTTMHERMGVSEGAMKRGLRFMQDLCPAASRMCCAIECFCNVMYDML